MTSTAMPFHLDGWRHHLFLSAVPGSRPSYRPGAEFAAGIRCARFIKSEGGEEEEEEEEEEQAGDTGGII